MADDTRDPTATAAASHTPAAAIPRKLPKGMVLGPDGKPCRTCNSLSAFTSQRRTLSNAAATSSSPLPDPNNCPPDVELLGRSSWTLLHSIASQYPSRPTPQEEHNVKTFMGLFAKLYPCWTCAEDFQNYLVKEEVKASSRDEFGKWLCEAHNNVNTKLGKPTFDCSRWEERWRTGWKDGSCD